MWKKEWPNTALVEEDVKSNGRSKHPAFDSKSFGHGDLTAKHVISGAQGLLC